MQLLGAQKTFQKARQRGSKGTSCGRKKGVRREKHTWIKRAYAHTARETSTINSVLHAAPFARVVLALRVAAMVAIFDAEWAVPLITNRTTAAISATMQTQLLSNNAQKPPTTEECRGPLVHNHHGSQRIAIASES